MRPGAAAERLPAGRSRALPGGRPSRRFADTKLLKKGAHGGNLVSPVTKRRGRDLNPRRTFRHVRDFQSRSLGHSDTSPAAVPE
jgi:hypothetical protein